MLITTSHNHLETSDAVVLRRARATDGRALRRLAALDDAAPLAGEALVAEQDGELRAAVSLHSGRAIADPFHRTADLVALLRQRRALLSGRSGGGVRGIRLRGRAARAI